MNKTSFIPLTSFVAGLFVGLQIYDLNHPWILVTVVTVVILPFQIDWH